MKVYLIEQWEWEDIVFRTVLYHPGRDFSEEEFRELWAAGVAATNIRTKYDRVVQWLIDNHGFLEADVVTAY